MNRLTISSGSWQFDSDSKILKIKHSLVEHLKDIVIYSTKDSFKQSEWPYISPLDGLSLLFHPVYLISKSLSELIICILRRTIKENLENVFLVSDIYLMMPARERFLN